MPQVTSGNTHAPAMMIGERAAELVAGALGARSTEVTHA
jgi:choline dehydrogenase-like flavoprotein